MRVLVTGASGLIGGAVVVRLLAAGHEVVGVARHAAGPALRVPAARWIAIDIAAATRPEDWLPCLLGIDAVVNCAGVLQDGAHDSTRGVHVEGVGALFAACERAEVRRVVQISAIGVDRGSASAFSATKREGDEALMRRDLDWVVLRPSVILGPAAYGGSALFRGLAALPVLPVMPDTGPLQVVRIEDVTATVEFFLAPDAPVRLALDLAGPERLSVTDIVRRYRAWLGWPEARSVLLPAWLAALAFGAGDFAGRLGWRAPVRTTAWLELRRGAIGDPGPWTALTGIVPQSLEAALLRLPASVQERWFAALYLLKPIAFAVLALFWIVTGLLSLWPGHAAGVGLMQQAGTGSLSGPAVIAGGLLNIAIGAAIAVRRTARRGLWAALAVSVSYLIAGTLLLPGLWAEPLGPLLKVFPIIVLNVVALAILEER